MQHIFQGLHGWIEACMERQLLKSNRLRFGAWRPVNCGRPSNHLDQTMTKAYRSAKIVKAIKRKPRFKLRRFHVLTRAATLNHTAAMPASLVGRWMVPWVAVCVLLLFLFPLVQGPFQATHGPNTAFRARRALIILVLSIIRCGMSVFAKLSASARVSACGLAMLHLFSERLQSDRLDSMILRC